LLLEKSPKNSFLSESTHFWTHHFDKKAFIKIDDLASINQTSFDDGIKISTFPKSMNFSEIKEEAFQFNDLINSLSLVFFDYK
jgi:hypothetical protein